MSSSRSLGVMGLGRQRSFLIHILCMMMASLRATAIRAFDIPMRLASLMPHALRELHEVVLVSSTVAAVTKALRTVGSPRLDIPVE